MTAKLQSFNEHENNHCSSEVTLDFKDFRIITSLFFIL